MYNSFDDLQYTISLEQHLQYNHVPSVSTDFIPACKTAIKNILNDNPDKIVKLPNGKRLTSRTICEGLHLWGYVDMFENDDDEVDNE